MPQARSIVVLIMGLVTASLVLPEPCLAQETKAVLIGVGKYGGDIPALPAAVKDARLLHATFRDRGWLPDANVTLMTDDADAALRPTRKNMREQLEKVTKTAGPLDHVVIFFAGHGIRDEGSKRTFLLPSDADRKRLAESSLDVAELRDLLVRSKAGQKLLIIDACHSGSFPGLNEQNVSDAVQGVYTLVSCQAGESSLETDNKGHGLFTYWLNRGLEGAADNNGDSRISADELNRFVQPLVADESTALGSPQHPGRIVPPNVQGDPELLALKPESYSAAVDRLSELLSEQLGRQKVSRVGVFEFLDASPLAPSNQAADRARERLALTAFAQNLSSNVEQTMRQRAKSDYQLVDGRTLLASAGEFSPALFTNAGQIRTIAANPDTNFDAYVTGSIAYIAGSDSANLNMKAIRVSDNVVLASVSGRFNVDAVLASTMLGRSVALASRGPTFLPQRTAELWEGLHPKPEAEAEEKSARTAESKSTKSSEPAPLPFTLEIIADGVAKPTYTEAGLPSLAVHAAAGEEFSLRFVNPTDKPVFVRFFVDGRNVIGNKFEPLDSARPWLFPPHSEKVISGWYHDRGVKDGAAVFDRTQFVFIDPPRKRGIRRTKFSDRPGTIQATIHAARPMAWVGKLGVGENVAKKIVEVFPSTELGGLCLGEPLGALTYFFVGEE